MLLLLWFTHWDLYLFQHVIGFALLFRSLSIVQCFRVSLISFMINVGVFYNQKLLSHVLVFPLPSTHFLHRNFYAYDNWSEVGN